MKVLTVYYHGDCSELPLRLGRLSFYKGKGQFEYSQEALGRRLELSPYHVRLNNGLIEATLEPFGGIHGLFSDSLPDGWGLYIMDNIFKKHGLDISGITPIDRLGFIGDRAMGALSYQPDEGQQYLTTTHGNVDIDSLAEESIQMYSGELEHVADELADVGSPSGGARPKALLGIKDDLAISGTHALPEGYSHWLIKFPTGKTPDKRSEGSIEYVYSEMARNAGIDFPETRLLAGMDNNHYFMVKRFDRDDQGHRIHIHTMAGLLNINFRTPVVGYADLLKLCSRITGSHKETAQLFRRMLFNIMSGNRDDHSKNFSFMMNPRGEWMNSPAYDVIYNYGMNGEHTMDVNGKGRNFTREDINELAKRYSLSLKMVDGMVGDIADALSSWAKEARHYNIPNTQITEIDKHINIQRKLLVVAPRAKERGHSGSEPK